MVTAEIDDIDIFRLQAGRQRAEILFAWCQRVIENFGNATGIQRGLEGIRQTLTVSALVMNDGDLLVLKLGKNVFRRNFGLLVVPTASAENIGKATVRQARRGRRGGDHQDTVFSKHVRCRNGNA